MGRGHRGYARSGWRWSINYKIDDGGSGFLYWRRGSGESLEIQEIEVVSPQRREGRGRRLVGRLIEVAEEMGVKKIYAITRAENRIAQEFYESLRFRSIPLYDFYGTKTEDGHKTVDAVMYVRDLESQA